MNLDLTFALLWMGIAGVHFYRFYTGTMPMGIVTLVTSERIAMTKRSRAGRIFLGIAYLGVGISHLVSYSRLAHH